MPNEFKMRFPGLEEQIKRLNNPTPSSNQLPSADDQLNMLRADQQQKINTPMWEKLKQYFQGS